MYPPRCVIERDGSQRALNETERVWQVRHTHRPRLPAAFLWVHVGSVAPACPCHQLLQDHNLDGGDIQQATDQAINQQLQERRKAVQEVPLPYQVQRVRRKPELI